MLYYNLCEDCFNNYYVNRLVKVVEKHHMFDEDDRIVVAIAGGKDIRWIGWGWDNEADTYYIYKEVYSYVGK